MNMKKKLVVLLFLLLPLPTYVYGAEFIELQLKPRDGYQKNTSILLNIGDIKNVVMSMPPSWNSYLLIIEFGISANSARSDIALSCSTLESARKIVDAIKNAKSATVEVRETCSRSGSG